MPDCNDDDSVQVVAEAMSRFGWSPPPDAPQRLLAYLAAILRCNDEGLNLTRVEDPAAAVVRHLVDSLAFGQHLSDAEAGAPRRIVDLGTGPGFPGVPVAFADPRRNVHLVDGRQKKIAAVRRALQEVGGPAPRAHGVRLVEFNKVLGPMDVVMARAVGPLDRLLREAAPALVPGGFLVAWKSEVIPEAELEAAAAEADRRRFTRWPDLVYLSDRPRRLVRYRKESR